MPRIVIPDDGPAVMLPSAVCERLRGDDVRTFSDRPLLPDELAGRISDAEVVINIRDSSRFTREVFDQRPKLQLLSIWGTGTDNVDLAAAKSRGVRVTNTPGVAAIAVAEHTLALIRASVFRDRWG
jgi:D-3-phosphoglycerate dehydrogenase / 2-oxoglutarate reductase